MATTRDVKRTGTVLLVEDNEDNRIVYSTMLEHVGYTVLTANDGKQGVEVALAQRPDVILMDVSLPVMDGWEATKVLKTDSSTSGIPIIALTAHALVTDRDKAFEVGCDDYLPKPVEPREVLAAVDRWIDESPSLRAKR